MRHSTRGMKNLTEEELEELLDKIKAKWQVGDPIIREFVDKVHKLRRENKIQNTMLAFEELLVRIIAEFLKRITTP